MKIFVTYLYLLYVELYLWNKERKKKSEVLSVTDTRQNSLRLLLLFISLKTHTGVFNNSLSLFSAFFTAFFFHKKHSLIIDYSLFLFLSLFPVIVLNRILRPPLSNSPSLQVNHDPAQSLFLTYPPLSSSFRCKFLLFKILTTSL